MTIDELAARYVRGEPPTPDERRALAVQCGSATVAAQMIASAQAQAMRDAQEWQPAPGAPTLAEIEAMRAARRREAAGG